MEKLKDPAMVLSGVNSLFLIGITAYFYKEVQTLHGDVGKVTQAMNGLITKLADIQKTDIHKTELLHNMNEKVKVLTEDISQVPSFEEFNGIDMDIEEIVAMLRENNIIVERPSLTPRPRRSGDRRRGTADQDVYERTRDTPRSSLRQPRRTTQQDDLDVIGEVRRQQPRT